jgi:hypothetical protein
MTAYSLKIIQASSIQRSAGKIQVGRSDESYEFGAGASPQS